VIPDCDKDVYENGKLVGVMAQMPAEAIELIVKRMAQDSGQKIDWHFVGGRAFIKTTGDVTEAQMWLPLIARPDQL
jgi:hypothetical protein